MENNGIILIDSSDDECVPSKIRKTDNKISSSSTQKCLNQNMRTSKIKKQEEIDDIVIIDDITSIENKYSTPTNEQNLFNTTQKESSVKFVKRIELTTFKDKQNTFVSTESTNLFINEEDEKDATELKNLNSDMSNSDNITVNRNPSTSSANISQNLTSPEFEAFLEACSICNCDIKYKNMIMKKISAIKCKYIDADINFVQSQQFKKYLIDTTRKIQRKPLDAIISFNDVYRELESKKKREVNFTEREERHLHKLYNALKKVHRKIKTLENEEVDFEEDSNSSYIMLERYKERLCTIRKKICSFTKENFYSGRYLFRNLDFSSSKYSEINRTIDKLYNKKKQFPSYYEVDYCIRKCVQNHKLNLTEDALNNEVRSVFAAVGNLLQRRRKMELYDSLTYYLDGSEDDPADKDPEFEAILQRRQVENEKKIDDILQRFTECQERDEDPEVSPDSDDSHHDSEDSDS